MNSLDQIQKLIDQNALFIINHSGGKDSQAMYLKLRDLVPASQLIIIHADLGRVEWDDLQDHIKNTMNEGTPFFVCKANYKDGREKDLITYTKDRGKFPSSSARWCTSDLKRDPIAKVTRKYMKDHGFTLAVNCMGIRAEESPGRAKQEPFRLNKRLTLKSGTRTVYDWLPIHEMLVDKVFDTIHNAGQEAHYIYSMGMNRLSCCFCIMASKKDLTIAAGINPELYKEYVDLEKELGFTLQSRGSLEEITGIYLEDE